MNGFPDDLALTVAPSACRLAYLPGDDPLMEQVEELCYRTLHEPFGVARQPDWDNMDPDSLHLAALEDGRVIGYARLIREGSWGHIRQVGVEPRYRRQGVARALVRELLAQSRRMGLSGAYLNSRMPAVALYEEAGFAVVSQKPFPMPRTGLPHVRMELRF